MAQPWQHPRPHVVRGGYRSGCLRDDEGGDNLAIARVWKAHNGDVENTWVGEETVLDFEWVLRK